MMRICGLRRRLRAIRRLLTLSGLARRSGVSRGGGGVGRIHRQRQRDRDRTAVIAGLLVQRDLAAGRERLHVRFRPAPVARVDHVLCVRRAQLDAGLARHRLRERKRREQLEVLGDRVLRITRDDRNRRVGAEQLTHAADVDDDVVSERDAPLLQQRLERRRSPRRLADRRIEKEERLAALAQVRSDRVDFGLQVVGRRTGNNQHRRIGGNTCLRLREHDSCRRCSCRASTHRRRWRSRAGRCPRCRSRRVPARNTPSPAGRSSP